MNPNRNIFTKRRIEPAWVSWVGGAVMGIIIALMLFWGI